MLHTRGEADSAAIAKDLYKELLGIDKIDGGNTGATLIHLGHLEVNYYGYLWSEVFSHDMFETRWRSKVILSMIPLATYMKSNKYQSLFTGLLLKES